MGIAAEFSYEKSVCFLHVSMLLYVFIKLLSKL